LRQTGKKRGHEGALRKKIEGVPAGDSNWKGRFFFRKVEKGGKWSSTPGHIDGGDHEKQPRLQECSLERMQMVNEKKSGAIEKVRLGTPKKEKRISFQVTTQK